MGSMIQIGPWAGEFGWEIMHWVPAVRVSAQNYGRVIVGCQEGSQALYADFATEYRTFPNVVEACCQRGDSKGAAEVENEFRGRGKWLQTRLKLGKKKYVRYGKRHPAFAYDLVIHARHTPKTKFGRSSLARNWPAEKWDQVLSQLGNISVAAIGLPREALCPVGATDVRGNDLQTVMDVLASSRLIAGPQSGPIHLAALCECPAVVWTRRDIGPGKHKNERRLKELWNPFGTPVTILDGFDIEPEPVIAMIQEEIECSVLKSSYG